MQPLRQHTLRFALTNELHARPYPVLRAPEQISHFALLTGESGAEDDRNHLVCLCDRYGVDPPRPNASHFNADFGIFRLKWERHTEFTTHTVLHHGSVVDPFGNPAVRLLPRDWVDAMPGELLVATNVMLETATPADALAEPPIDWFVAESLCCSRVGGGGGVVWTDFRIQEDGFSRFLVRAVELDGRRAGRLVQRLLEIETYRTMALLALPPAREVGPAVTAIDRTLADLMAQMKALEHVDEERRLLERLTGLAAEVEALQAATAYRFGAARAYDALIRSRIAELRETRIEGYQTIQEFMERRFAPAMRTCASVAKRLDQLSRRVTRASTLLRTRVDIAVETQTQGLLASVERSTRLQANLQQTVEGLSVAAISYYVLGLLHYAAEALEGAGYAIAPKAVVGLALPPVVAAVWLTIRRIRRGAEKTETQRGPAGEEY